MPTGSDLLKSKIWGNFFHIIANLDLDFSRIKCNMANELRTWHRYYHPYYTIELQMPREPQLGPENRSQASVLQTAGHPLQSSEKRLGRLPNAIGVYFRERFNGMMFSGWFH